MGSDPIFADSASADAADARLRNMARLRRQFIPGVPTHVIVRGNDRQAVFVGDGDRLAFLFHLREAAQKHGLAIHAYVLMTNHVHLLATGCDRNSSSLTMQALGRKYVPGFNRRHKRTGTLWEGRHRSTLVQTERYALCCHRYIEMNPVRAAIAPEPAGFIWSSYLHYAHGKPDDLVTQHDTYLALGPDQEERRRRYRELCGEALDDELVARIRTASHCGWPVGDDAFLAEVARLTGRRAAPAEKGRPRAPKRLITPASLEIRA
jgi:putative transposase